MIWYFVLLLGLFSYAAFSYILTDPNLVLSTQPLYWNFQQYLWNTFYSNSELVSLLYVGVIVLITLAYIGLYVRAKQSVQNVLQKKHIVLYLLIILPLLFSYNALSHDIFNYIFNAKMIVEYGANPHVTTALEFPQDEWTRFMHNTHTAAPYGYGWTILSLVPFIAGLGYFSLTWLSFRAFMILSIILLYFALQHLSQTLQNRKLYLSELLLVFCNPLFLLEVVSNFHNDLWMLIPAVFSVSYLLKIPQVSLSDTKKRYTYLLLAVVLLGVSISIKLVTVVLVPLYLLIITLSFFANQYAYLLKKRFHIPLPTTWVAQGTQFLFTFVKKYIPALIVLCLFVPLLTGRSQQFHPWYLLWVLVWIPFLHSKLLRSVILVFSITSLLRYVPWLLAGYEYSDTILLI